MRSSSPTSHRRARDGIVGDAPPKPAPITEFTLVGGDSKESGNRTTTKAPLEIQKLVVQPTVQSLPHRLCEKRHDLHEVIFQEEDEQDHDYSCSYDSGNNRGRGRIVDVYSNRRNQLRSLGDYCFAECLQLSRLSIPSSVERIGKNACSGCKLLVEVDLLSSGRARVKHIGFCAFYQCQSLIQIHIPATVEEIEGHAFHGCKSLRDVELLAYKDKTKRHPVGSLVIGPSVFLDCIALRKIYIPTSLEKLPKSCFHTCSALKEVSLPEGMKKIKANSFIHCAKLEYVKIPSTVELIQRDAFKGCKSLEVVHFGDGQHQSILKDVEWEAFMDCIALRKVKIPSTLTVVKSSVFFGCTALVDVELSEGVQEIQHSAFGTCTALQAIVLPQSIELIGIRAFAGCPRLVTVEIPPTQLTPNFRIRKDAFVNGRSLINVSLPKSATEKYKEHGPDASFGGGFGENGFAGCTHLEREYGSDLTPLLMGDVVRFHPYHHVIHKLCYHASVTSLVTLQNAIQAYKIKGQLKNDNNAQSLLVDAFGMTPFHILLTAGKRRVDMLQVLLDTYPPYLLGWKDVTGKTAIDYCFLGWNWSAESIYMLQLCLQAYVTSRLELWGGMDLFGDIDLSAMINAILSEDDNERQQELWKTTEAVFHQYQQMETMTVLELGLWKQEIEKRKRCTGGGRGGEDGREAELRRDANEREIHRARCGSPFVVPNVAAFLKGD